MKKAVFWIQIIAITISVFAVIFMGFEIYGHMDPNKIIVEAYIILVCLVVNAVCAVTRYYMNRKKE